MYLILFHRIAEAFVKNTAADEGKFYVDTSSERIKTGIDVYFSATQPTPETKEAIWFKTEITASDNVSNEENE